MTINTNLASTTPLSDSNISNQGNTTANNVTSDSMANKTAAESNNEKSSTTKFSSRAEKMAALNKEFNISSPSFKLDQNFINRLSDFGLISENDSVELNKNLPLDAYSSADDNNIGTIKELSQFIDDFSKKLKNQENSSEGLLEILQQSKKVLNNLSGSQESISPTVNALGLVLQSEEALSFSAEEKKAIEDIQSVLKVANSLNPNSRNSDNINAYMSILGN